MTPCTISPVDLTRDEVKRALKWLDQLEREQEREEMEERGRRYRRKAKRAADIVKLVPPSIHHP